MNNRRTPILIVSFLLLVILLIAGISWANYQFAKRNPGGNDFIPRWLGTQLFVFEKQNPYSPEVTQAIQKFIYGRAARPGEDQVLFVYPFYSFVVFMPFAVIRDYLVARAAWMTVLELALLALAWLSLVLSRWRISLPMLAGLLLFTALWYHGVRPVINGNASILCALFITLAMWAISGEHDALAGFLLALASIKPQMVALLIPFVLLWAWSQRRWVLFWSALTSLVFLVALGMLFNPGWLLDFVRQLVAYPGYTLPGTPGAILAKWVPGVGSQMGWALTVFMAGILFWEWRAVLRMDFRWFLWTAYLTLTVTNLIGIRTATENYIALYPALVLVLAVWDERWGALGRGLVIISLLLLLAGLWWLFLVTLEHGAQPVQSGIMFFPLPIFLVIGLYWARWWAIRPPPPLLDQLRMSTQI